MEKVIINRIKVVLVEKQKTSIWLAEQLGKSKITVSRWVSNRSQPSLDQLLEISKILDVDVRELINTSKNQTI